MDLRKLHTMVWDTRRQLGDKWPTPDPADSLRFAFTEAGEAMDAWLRRNPTYQRNNARESSVNAELADCAMMLLTAIGPEWPSNEEDNLYVDIEVCRLEYLCRLVAEIMDRKCAWNRNEDPFILDALRCIAAYPGLDLQAELTARLAAIVTKCAQRDGLRPK